MSPPDTNELHSANSLEELRSAVQGLELGPIEDQPVSIWRDSTKASPRTIDLVQRLVLQWFLGLVVVVLRHLLDPWQW